ncbi:MAG: N-acetylmuramoyl-L-alanine amidase [Bacillota bacterium]|nr:N-acetylmuramoyl-L-alanine amidase [Bacillota bacterium]
MLVTEGEALLKRPVVVVWTPRAWLVTTAAIGAVVVMLLVLARAAVRVSAPLSDAVCGKVIVIDPGHGGDDCGARGRSGLAEKDVVLDIGRHLAGLFNRVAVYTVMTRDEDEDLAGDGSLGPMQRKRLDLESRVDLGARSGADLYISVHANSFPEPVWSGAQTFYHSKSEESKALAQAIQKELVARLGPNLRKAKPGDDYFVLRKSKMPAVIVEAGFLSNPREESLLAQPDYRRRVAEAIFHGTVNYLVESYKRRRGAEGQRAGAEPVSDLRTEGPPHDGAESVLRSKVRAALNPADDEVILYFAGPTNFDDDLLPEIRKTAGIAEAASPEERASKIVAELLKGPAGGSVLCPTIPKGTRLRALRIADGVAYVDFSRELASSHWGGSRAEEITVYSIVNTLAELPEVERVQILVEGASAVTIAGHVILDEPLEPNFDLVRFAK